MFRVRPHSVHTVYNITRVEGIYSGINKQKTKKKRKKSPHFLSRGENNLWYLLYRIKVEDSVSDPGLNSRVTWLQSEPAHVNWK